MRWCPVRPGARALCQRLAEKTLLLLATDADTAPAAEADETALLRKLAALAAARGWSFMDRRKGAPRGGCVL